MRKKLILIATLIFIIFGALIFLTSGPYDYPKAKKEWGITFSIPYAKQLGLNWQEAYRAMLDDLSAREIRLPVYWPIIEPERHSFDFTSTDFLIKEAKKRNAKILLAVGRRLPRYPECHAPDWAKNLSESEQRQEILKMLEVVINHYRGESAIWGWQIENEPFVRFFGECPKYDEKFLEEEVALVKTLDPNRPVITTDSGELSLWFPTARQADLFGTTIYRIVPSLDKKGFVSWHLPPEFYNKKANLLSKFLGKTKIFVSELQAEAWAQGKPIQELTIKEQYASMSPRFFHETIAYVRQTGFDRVYLWGAEWWYWLKLKGEEEIWDEAKSLFR